MPWRRPEEPAASFRRMVSCTSVQFRHFFHGISFAPCGLFRAQQTHPFLRLIIIITRRLRRLQGLRRLAPARKQGPMGKLALVIDRRLFQRLLLHMGGFLLVFVTALWLRQLAPKPDAILQGYLQITTGLFAFVFAAVALVRFQGTQDRVSLILGSGFLLSGATLTASSLLFFQLIHENQIWV